MSTEISGAVGPKSLTDGSTQQAFRQSRTGGLATSDEAGRFYEATSRGTVFSHGMSVTALSANTITLTATTTPILGVYNPSTSPVNLEILQASLQSYPNTLTTPASPGAFVWAVSTGNTAISTGSNPLNRKTLTATGSQAKGMCFVALTGLTNNLVIQEGADFGAQGPLAYGTIVAPTASGNALTGISGVQNFDGSLIIPPGGVLALLNTTSTTTFSVAGRIMWREIPL